MSASLFRLDGKIALVTGASRGIGWSIAEAFAEAGATVVLNGRYPETLEERAEILRKAGHNAAVAAFDVADFDALKAGIAAVEASQGRIDILVNNAGATRRQPLADWTLADWQSILDVNLTSCFLAAQAVAPGMVARGFGRIINTASILSTLGRPNIHGYVATKTGLVGLTRSLAVELGGKGVTVNAIGPGYIKTAFTVPMQNDAEFNAGLLRRVPMGRWGEPEEIAGAAVFLAAPAGAYVNGQLLNVDGGLLASL